MMLTCLQIHNDYLIPGGETKSAILIANLLEERGIRVIRYYKSNDSLNMKDIENKISYGLKSFYNKQTVEELQGIMDQEHVDFALVHNTSPLISNSVYTVLRKNGIRTIKYLQNYNLLCLNGALDHGDKCEQCQKNSIVGIHLRCYKGSILYSLQKSISKHFLWSKHIQFIDDFIAISEYVKEKHNQSGVKASRIHVIYHFCEEKPRVVAESRSDYIVYMGRLSQEKGIMTFIKAMLVHPSIRLIIMGKGDMEEEIRGFVLSNGIKNVELIGYKTGAEKNKIVGNALALVIPSEWEEPFGRIAIEAYQVGTPVIASRTGGLQELVIQCETGYLFTPGDVESLSEAIGKVKIASDNEIAKMRENCVEAVKDRFSKDAYYARFQEVLKG